MGDVRLTPRQVASLFDALDSMAEGVHLVRQVLIDAMAARERSRHELRIMPRKGRARPRRKARAAV